jgi:glycosyltransferase involved in cell wall biosynthesis
MDILMLGWEFPPHFSGGLGVVCYELTKIYAEMGIDTVYIMPFGPKGMEAEYVDLVIADNFAKDPNIRVEQVPSLLTPYATTDSYYEIYEEMEPVEAGQMEGVSKKVYSETLFEEVMRFGNVAEKIAKYYDFDIIHAHDWMTFPAAKKIQQLTGTPMIAHVHATEFDRTGGHNVNQHVYDLEREGMHHADIVIAVSERVRNRCVYQYGVDQAKTRVVYNAVNLSEPVNESYTIKEQDKIVLSLGRITLQKGPEYFIEAAKKVCDHDPNVKFVMAGNGDMLQRMIHKAAELGIGDRVIFPGFVSRDNADRLYRMADVFVMPSVSEPFGLVPLEAMVQETPVIISKQSGISEVLENCIKVDFWDTDRMAQKILALLHYRELNDMLKHHGSFEVQKFDWEKPATQCLKIYEEAKRMRGQ